MHYRNGREAKNGDKIVKLEGGKVVAFGVLHSDAWQRLLQRQYRGDSAPQRLCLHV